MRLAKSLRELIIKGLTNAGTNKERGKGLFKGIESTTLKGGLNITSRA